MIALVCLGALVWQSPQLDGTANADYLLAGQIVTVTVELQPPTDGNVLEWAEKAVEKYGKAFEWVQTGNKKPIQPIDSLKPGFRALEALQAENIGRLFEAQLFKQIADGNPNKAASALVDGLTYARNIQTLNASSYENGSIAIQGLLQMFDVNRRAFAEKGLEEISKVADRLLKDPAERLGMLAEINAYKNSPDFVTVSPRIAAIEKKWNGFFDSEERRWDPGKPENADKLVDLEIGLQYYTKLATVIRTKLRLLKATVEILLHDMRQYKLPDAYNDTYDPATGEPLFYGKRDDAFVIYSKGTDKTGRIDLATFWETK